MPAKTSTPISVAEIAANLRAIRAGASAEHVAEGTRWYPAMARFIADIADEAFHATGDVVAFSTAAGVFAAFSQNATWKANVTMATRYLNGGGARGLKSVVAEIERIENGEDPATAIGSLKRPDFYRNLIGESEYVTCDRWHLRAAFGADVKISLSPQVHADVTEATRIVAAEYGEEPSTTQAIIWCAVRGTGE